MATFHMANHSYEINSYADLASVRAQLEELHLQKRVTDNTYEIKMKELDRFSHNHHLSKYVMKKLPCTRPVVAVLLIKE